MRELNNVKVIGIDHGFGNVKVASACFRSGVTLCEKEPTFKTNLLVYEGRYYLVGESHKEFTPDKMRDEDYYILTLAAIAEYNGPWVSDQGSKKEREHGMMKQR